MKQLLFRPPPRTLPEGLCVLAFHQWRYRGNRERLLCMLPYFGKRKQVTKVTFLVKEQNVSVISTDVNGISWCLTEHISQQDEYLCIKIGLEEEYIRQNMKTSIIQIWMVCHLLPFAKVGQYASSTNTLNLMSLSFSMRSPPVRGRYSELTCSILKGICTSS